MNDIDEEAERTASDRGMNYDDFYREYDLFGDEDTLEDEQTEDCRDENLDNYELWF